MPFSNRFHATDPKSDAILVSHRALVALNVASYAPTPQRVVGLGQLRVPDEDHAQLRAYVVEKEDILEDTFQGDSISADAASLAAAFSDIPPQSPETLATSHPSITLSDHASHDLTILPEEEAYLADEYFKSINEAIPLFSKETVIVSREILSACSRDLVEALLLITAKLLDFKFASTPFGLDSRIDQILSATSLQEDTAGDFPTLDSFRKFCLLAFYEFHQFPGQQAWMRIGKLVRLAYWMGLDRLDIIQSVSIEWSSVSDKDLQDWKLIWWCVYRLDSCYYLPEGDDWTLSWQRVLEICQNVAGIAEKWDSNYTLTVDPAVAFISFTALIFLDVHKKYTEATNTHLISEIENCELLLLLQLEQFSSHWKLPSLLIRKSQPPKLCIP
ncbi:fungal specific transcription factor factor [Fusarium beomiforme]|uniref:Fungal specific transcription factor factor n=1 Tax=Fusarium beomiforme TaxID=44412 RepID=A0A9P5DSR0_9HYPO|nr:fungal specific transcription factor factor [Fusarium beomiforme]